MFLPDRAPAATFFVGEAHHRRPLKFGRGNYPASIDCSFSDPSGLDSLKIFFSVIVAASGRRTEAGSIPAFIAVITPTASQ